MPRPLLPVMASVFIPSSSTATACTSRAQTLTERSSGKPRQGLWKTLAHEAEFTRKNPKNSHASATPACDGQRVYSVFLNRDGLHVTGTNLDGKILWQTKA